MSLIRLQFLQIPKVLHYVILLENYVNSRRYKKCKILLNIKFVDALIAQLCVD